MSVLSLPEAKAHLRMKETDNNAGLQEVIDHAESIVGLDAGPLSVQAATTVRVSGGPQLVLPLAPVDAVTAITSTDGQTIDLTTVTVNKAAGLVYFTDGWTGFRSASYDVTYSAGYTTVPDGLMWGLKECVRELWMTQRGARGAGTGQTTPTGGTGWQQWVEPYRLPSVGAW